MRVVHLLNHVRFGHGNVHACVDLALAQAAAGDEVHVAAGPGEYQKLLAGHGVAHVAIDQERRRPRDVLRQLYQLVRLIRRVRPDVLHAHMMTGALVGRVAGLLTRTPLVTTVHNSFDAHARLMGVGARVIAVSHAVKAEMARKGVSADRIRVVQNGTIGAARRDFFPPQRYDLPHPNVATLCGMHDRKGVQDLIAAFAILARELPDVSLCLGGDGPHLSRYRAQAAALPCADRILFAGEVRDTKAFLAATDIFVLASHAEPWGLVITEAREAGCAIVGTAVGGIPEAIDGGAAGVLVPVRDPPALGVALSAILRDPARLQALRAAARAGVGRFSVDRVAADTRAVYAEVATARNAA